MFSMVMEQEKFEHTYEIIINHKSKDRQYNGKKKKKTKGQTLIYKNLHRKLKIEEHEPH
jgi:hypothetical protein